MVYFFFGTANIQILIKLYEYEPQLINIDIKICYISMSTSLKFNYITYKINKMIVFIYLPIKIIINKQEEFFLIYVFTPI